MSDLSQAPVQKPATTAATSKAKSKPVYQRLTGGAQKQPTFDLKASVSASSVKAVSSRCPVGVPFVAHPESRELFVKLSKACVISLSSGQRYDAEGVDAYFVTIV